MHPGVSLTDAMDQWYRDRAILPDGIDGLRRMVLNPEFIEALMGFPIGWTDSGCLGTPSSPPKRAQLSMDF